MGISWSAMRKALEEDNICDSLKGRIQYFATRYRKSHDQEGRVAIRLDGKEIFKSCYFDWYAKEQKVLEQHIVSRIPNEPGRCFWDRVYLEVKNLGGFDPFAFYDAFYEYKNHKIEESLCSTDPIVRLFAFFDKRTGKRKLQRMSSELYTQPEWLQVLFRLRLQAEGIQERRDS